MHSQFLGIRWINKNQGVREFNSMYYDVDLETMFPGNPLLKGISKGSVGITHKCYVCLQFAKYI